MDIHKKMGQKSEALGTYFNSSHVSCYNYVKIMGRGDAVMPYRKSGTNPTEILKHLQHRTSYYKSKLTFLGPAKRWKSNSAN